MGWRSCFGQSWEVQGHGPGSAIGAVWMEIHLVPPTKAVAFWTVLYGTYANWGFTVLAAVFGTMAMSPVTGAEHRGEPWQESLVSAGFVSVGVTIIVAVMLMLWGLRQTLPPR